MTPLQPKNKKAKAQPRGPQEELAVRREGRELEDLQFTIRKLEQDLAALRSSVNGDTGTNANKEEHKLLQKNLKLETKNDPTWR